MTIWNPKKGTKRAIGFLNHGDSSVAHGINNLSHITGSGGLVDASQHVFLWSKEEGLIDLGKPAETPFAAYGTAINDHDKIVGISDPSVFETPLYWSQAIGFRLLQKLNSGSPAYASAINELGQIFGCSSISGTSNYRAVLWNDNLSAPTNLGTLPGGTYAFSEDLNNVGQVVGYSHLPAN